MKLFSGHSIAAQSSGCLALATGRAALSGGHIYRWSWRVLDGQYTKNRPDG